MLTLLTFLMKQQSLQQEQIARLLLRLILRRQHLRVIAGPEKKSAIVTERDKRITAYHEAGHAVAAYFLETCEKVHQVTVIQRGMAAGLTVTRPVKDDRHVTKKYLLKIS